MKRDLAEILDCLAIALFVGTVVVPALGAAGCTFHWDVGLPWCIALAALGGGGAGALREREHRAAGIVAGVTMGVATLLAIYFYVDGQLQRRDLIYTTELYVPFCIGLLPGLGLFYLLAWLLPNRGSSCEPAK